MMFKHLNLRLTICYSILAAICGCCNSANGQQIRVNRLYNFSNDTGLASAVSNLVTDTNRFFIVGSTRTLGVSNEQAFYAGLDYSGNVEWQHKITFPGKYNSVGGFDILARDGKNYICGGAVEDFTINSRVRIVYPYLYRFDANGDSLFSKVYQDTIVSSTFNSVASDQLGNIIAAGTITGNTLYSDGSGGYGYDSISTWLVKFDSVGYKIWEHKLFTVSLKVAISTVNKLIISSDQASYYFAGDRINPDSALALYPSITKTDSSGNLIWSKFLPCGYPAFNSQSYNVDIIPDKSGGCYFAATYSVYPRSTKGEIQFYYLLFGQINSLGDTVWTRKYTRDKNWMAVSNRIALSKDGYLIISILASGDGTYTANYERPALIKADTFGNVLWYREKERIHNFNPQQFLPTLSIAPNNAIVQAGYVYNVSPSPGIYDSVGAVSWIVISDSSGLSRDIDTFLDTPDYLLAVNPFKGPDESINVFPNPATDNLNLSRSGNQVQNIKLQIFDLTGKIVLSTNVQMHESPSKISLRSLIPGTYIYRIITNTGSVMNGSIIKR